MEKPTKDEVRKSLEDFYKEENDTKTQVYNGNIVQAAKALCIGPDVLRATLEDHDVAAPPLRTPVFEDQVKYLLQALEEVVDTSLYQMEHRDVIEFKVSVSLKSDEEPAPLEAVIYVVRKLLNLNVTSAKVDTFVSEGDIYHEWEITGKGWVDPALGAERRRIHRLKRTRESIASLEASLLNTKKRLLELGGKVCTCADAALAKDALPSATAASDVEPSN